MHLTIKFDRSGVPMPDSKAEQFARKTVAATDEYLVVSICNACVFHWLRAALLQIPVDKRPRVTWMVDGREVHFDDDLRTKDSLTPALDAAERALDILIGG